MHPLCPFIKVRRETSEMIVPIVMGMTFGYRGLKIVDWVLQL